jgi:hypothetical protein
LATCCEEEDHTHNICQNLEGNFALSRDHKLLESSLEVELEVILEIVRDFEVENSGHAYANNPRQCG